ncbi:hypothetical protein AAV94_00310 [Lampropedia cohaerens]|uniref:Uncharacterized protein n=1 Tax=Lampropedia cohaerens TaxID=1610491 RepID=A0A0U1Q3R3_9BURK|nr:hypothetical protein AAV94_00310 [Lampropedia cohaerens]
MTLTPQGVLHAFGTPEPDAQQQALQALLSQPRAISKAEWGGTQLANADLPQCLKNQWVQSLAHAVNGPDTRLSDFIRHVIAPISGTRRAVLASDSGFCLDRIGIAQEEADAVSAAAADFSEYARRQSRRGWHAANRYVAFYDDPMLLMPAWTFVPFWVAGAGYWLIIAGEPLLNNLALVELVWGICLAGNRFRSEF